MFLSYEATRPIRLFGPGRLVLSPFLNFYAPSWWNDLLNPVKLITL